MADKYDIPVLIPQRTTAAAKRNRPPGKRGMKPVISNAVVQAMRHDFDHGLMSVAQVAEKHGVNYHTAWDIVQRRSRQGTEGA